MVIHGILVHIGVLKDAQLELGIQNPAAGIGAAASLEFPQEQTELVQALKAAGANVVSVVIMNRAYVLTPISDASDSVLLVYRPGITCGAEAVADALFGETAIRRYGAGFESAGGYAQGH